MMKFFGPEEQQLYNVRPTQNKWVDSKFPENKAVKADAYNKLIGYEHPGAPVNDPWLPVVRVIEWKKVAEPHKCDSRCETAKGRKCECSCGGENHGKNR